jgi:hypothetical protein
VLLQRSAERREQNDERRLEQYYRKEFRLNRLLGVEALPEPCDPRQPEFRPKCLPNAGLRPPSFLQ